MQRRGLVVGNWKMNGLIETAQELVASIREGMTEREELRFPAEVVLCPPATALYPVHQWLSGSSIKLGAQNMAPEPFGAFTGEISGIMLRNVGCRYVILGHSERRRIFGESDDLVARKVAAAFRDGLAPILCLGEDLAEREANNTLEVVAQQLRHALQSVGAEVKWRQLVLAYEPIWAIGTGHSASVSQVTEVHDFLRDQLVEFFGQETGDKIRILYGGSIRSENAAELFRVRNVDGGLVGGASLIAPDFLQILDGCDQSG